MIKQTDEIIITKCFFHLKCHFREEVEKSEQEIEELRAKLRVQDALSGVDQNSSVLAAGLCIRCGQNEAVLPSTIAGHKHTIDRITRSEF